MPIYAWWWELQSKQEEAKAMQEVAARKPWQNTPQMAAARKRHAEKMRRRNDVSNPSG